MKGIVAILVSILALAACNSIPKEQIAIDDNSNQVVSFYDFNGRVFKKDILPIDVLIPSKLVSSIPSGGLVASSWVDHSDVERVNSQPPKEPNHSYFITKLSTSVIFNDEFNGFQFSRGGKEQNTIKLFKERMAQSGMKDVMVERFDPLGFPVLVVEATRENNTKARLIYVGTNIETNTIIITFVGKNHDDEVVWKNFVDSVVTSR
ncbi:hypothetical protein LPR20_003615 [Vibrio mimicus]